MSIIKEANEQLQIKALEESAKEGNPFAAAEIEARKHNLTEEGKCGGEGKCGSENEEEGFSKDQMSDMKKLVKQYMDGTVHVAPSDKIKLMLGDDLEMLEYSPKEIEKMVPQIMKMINK